MPSIETRQQRRARYERNSAERGLAKRLNGNNRKGGYQRQQSTQMRMSKSDTLFEKIRKRMGF